MTDDSNSAEQMPQGGGVLPVNLTDLLNDSAVLWGDRCNGTGGNSSSVCTTPDEDAVFLHYKTASHTLQLVLLPLIFSLGVFGNGVSFAVLQSRFYRETSTGFLLSALAVCDSLSLLTGMLRKWILLLSENSLDVRLTGHATCVIHFFLTYTSQAVGSWTLVAFTVERTMAVCFPLQMKRWFSRRRVILAWSAMIAVVVLFYSHLLCIVDINVLQYHGAGIPQCAIQQKYRAWDYDVYFAFVDLVIMAVVPSVIIGSANIFIICRLCSRRRNSRLTRRGCEEADRLCYSVTVMLILVSLVFVLVNIPYALYYSTHNYIQKETSLQKGRDLLASTCINTAYYFNNAINFLLYCLSAERFRLALASVVCRLHFASHEATMGTRLSLSSSARLSLEMHPINGTELAKRAQFARSSVSTS